MEEGAGGRFGDRLEREQAEGLGEGVERSGGNDGGVFSSVGGGMIVAGLSWLKQGTDGGGELMVAAIR